MPFGIRAAAAIVRHELVAYAAAGVILRHVWHHGIDHWSVILLLGLLGLVSGRFADLVPKRE